MNNILKQKTYKDIKELACAELLGKDAKHFASVLENVAKKLGFDYFELNGNLILGKTEVWGELHDPDVEGKGVELLLLDCDTFVITRDVFIKRESRRVQNYGKKDFEMQWDKTFEEALLAVIENIDAIDGLAGTKMDDMCGSDWESDSNFKEEIAKAKEFFTENLIEEIKAVV